MTIRRKLLIFGTGIVAVPLIIIGLIVNITINNSFKDIVHANLSLTVKEASKIISENIENEINSLEEISISNTALNLADALKENADSPDKEKIKLMKNMLINNKEKLKLHYENMALTNINGIVVCDSSKGKSPVINLSNREYFKKAISGETCIGDIVSSKTTGEKVIITAIPLKTSDGEIAGVIAGIIKMAAYTEYVEKIKIGETGYISIVDSKGLLVVHPDDAVAMKILISKIDGLEEISKKILNKKSGVGEYEYKDVGKISAFSYLNLTGWSIMANQNISEVMSGAFKVRNVIIIVGSIFVIISTILVVFYAGGISNPLRKAMLTADAVSKGDFTGRLILKRSDEIGHLSDALDNMADNLEAKAKLAKTIASGDLRADVEMASEKDTLGEALKNMADHLNSVIYKIRTASEEVMSGAQQVSDSSQSLSQGASEQAGSMEEITSSMTQIASQINQNAENATQCESLAKDSQHYAEIGNNEMHNMITAMTEISDSSKEIEKIIKAIDEIAFQTNLLALNAAVEAARAGRHGKGFAVVAEEVRNLAARSAKAAKETAELIEGSARKVDSGMEIAEKTAESFTKIVESGSKVSSLVAEIATACNDQAQGVSQINQGLNQMDQVTQTNTANAEETASASEELSGQAVELRHLIANFKLRNRNIDVNYKSGKAKNDFMPTGKKAETGENKMWKNRLLPHKSVSAANDSLEDHLNIL